MYNYSMETIKNYKNIDYVTFLQSFAVVLVLLGHSIPKVIEGNIPLGFDLLHKLIYTFHMPLFFVISGFLLAKSFVVQSKSILSFKTFVIDKFKRLIIPYISIGTLAYCLKAFIFNKFAYRPAEVSFEFYIKSLLIPWDNPNIYLWFLPTIFAILILGYFLLKINILKVKKMSLILFFLFLFISNFSTNINISLFNFKGIIFYFFYFYLGILFFIYKDVVFKILVKFYILIILFLMFVLCFFINNYIFENIYGISYLLTIIGILFSFSLALFFSNKNIKFCYGLLDGIYYQIYLLSWFFQTGFRMLYQINLFDYEIVCLLMFLGGIIFPLIIVKIINKYFTFLKIFIGLK